MIECVFLLVNKVCPLPSRLEGKFWWKPNVCFQQGNPSRADELLKTFVYKHVMIELLAFPVLTPFVRCVLTKISLHNVLTLGIASLFGDWPSLAIWLECNMLFRWIRYDFLRSPTFLWAALSGHTHVDSHEQEWKCLWRSLRMNAMAFWFLSLSLSRCNVSWGPV